MSGSDPAFGKEISHLWEETFVAKMGTRQTLIAAGFVKGIRALIYPAREGGTTWSGEFLGARPFYRAENQLESKTVYF